LKKIDIEQQLSIFL